MFKFLAERWRRRRAVRATTLIQPSNADGSMRFIDPDGVTIIGLDLAAPGGDMTYSPASDSWPSSCDTGSSYSDSGLHFDSGSSSDGGSGGGCD
jgi:hypothetical protein